MKLFRNLAILAILAPLLASCAGTSASKTKVSDGLVEIIREEYQIDQIGQDRFIIYKGVLKNWKESEVYTVSASFIAYDKAGLPTVDFKTELAPKMASGESRTFEIKKHVVGTQIDTIKARVAYSNTKPSLFPNPNP